MLEIDDDLMAGLALLGTAIREAIRLRPLQRLDEWADAFCLLGNLEDRVADP